MTNALRTLGSTEAAAMLQVHVTTLHEQARAGLVPGAKLTLITMHANFLLGTLAISENARLKLKRIPFDLIARHAVNEHGKLSKREQHRNVIGMKTIGEITSRYAIDPTDETQGNVLVVTQHAWNETVVKLENE